MLVRQAFGAGVCGHLTPSSATCQGSLGRVGLKTSPSALHDQAQGPLMLGTGIPHSWICLDSLCLQSLCCCWLLGSPMTQTIRTKKPTEATGTAPSHSMDGETQGTWRMGHQARGELGLLCPLYPSGCPPPAAVKGAGRGSSPWTMGPGRWILLCPPHR